MVQGDWTSLESQAAASWKTQSSFRSRAAVSIMWSSYGLTSQGKSLLITSLLHYLYGCHCAMKRFHKTIALLFPVLTTLVPSPIMASLLMGNEQLQICPGHRRVTTNVLQNLTHFPWHTLTITLLLFLLSYLWYS